MIYQCTGCNQDKDDDKDIGTLILGEDYYCEGCLASRNAVIDEVIMRIHMDKVFFDDEKEYIIEIIESLKGE